MVTTIDATLVDVTNRGESAVADLFHYGVPGMKWGTRKKEDTLDRSSIPDSPFKVGQKINDLPNQTITKSDIRGDNEARQKVRDGADLSPSAIKSLTKGPERRLDYSPKENRVITGDDIKYPTKTKGYDPLVGGASGFDAKSARKGLRNDALRNWGIAAVTTAAVATTFIRQSDEDENSLEHYGVKGMRWGVTTKNGIPVATQTREKKSVLNSKDVTVTQRKAGTYVQTKGGQRQKASEDAVKAQASRQKAKRSTTDSLSTKELKDTIERMRLEQEFSKLDKKVSRKGKTVVRDIISNVTAQTKAAKK